jgi:hypothetical protein
MNTDRLAKLYDRLTPRERLPLIAAASARGDEVERERLARSAPRKVFAVPDYFGLSEGLVLGGLFHVAELLNLAGMYWHCSGRLERSKGRKKGKKDKANEARAGLVRMLAYLIVVNRDAWKRCCAELEIDPDVLLREMPGYNTLAITEQAARLDAFTPAEATAALRRERGGEVEAPTVEGVAATLRGFIDQRAQWWD